VVFPSIVDPLTLEAMACREALVFADDLGLSFLMVVSDCKGVVQDISEGTCGVYASVIEEISLHSSEFLRRKQNMEAHNLARYALSLGQGRRVVLGII
jgi:hypothetical protein